MVGGHPDINVTALMKDLEANFSTSLGNNSGGTKESGKPQVAASAINKRRSFASNKRMV
jgi:hypothetical protein